MPYKTRATLERELAETRAILGDLLEDRGEAPLQKIRRKAQWLVIGSLFDPGIWGSIFAGDFGE
jgi:hypothetical protein